MLAASGWCPHGYLPEREIVPGTGPRTAANADGRGALSPCDRAGGGSERIRFSLAILLPYAHRQGRKPARILAERIGINTPGSSIARGKKEFIYLIDGVRQAPIPWWGCSWI
jgi:hypothetical protein